MSIALFAVSLVALLAGHWWALSRVSTAAVQAGQLAITGVWLGGWLLGVFVAGLPTVFLDRNGWAFAVGITLAGAINTWVFARSAYHVGRARRRRGDV